MSRGPKSLRLADYLGHILEAAERRRHYTAGLTEDGFSQAPMVQDAVMRNLELIGEACRNVLRHSPQFVAAHPEIPWQRPYEMRNVLSHGYFDIDLGRTWAVVAGDLPAFEAQVRTLLADLDQPPTATAPSPS